jgi:hypothetical protein
MDVAFSVLLSSFICKIRQGKVGDMKKCMYSKDQKTLQIAYSEYVSLMERVEQGRRFREAKEAVLANLQRFLDGEPATSVAKKTVQSSEKTTKGEVPQKGKAVAEGEESPSNKSTEHIEIPPIKKDIAEHFNKQDESGRLFNVVKQYYTFLNDACGGTVRVTMKDGVCSLWNYDEWEEFAFLDVLEGQVRISLDSRYTDKLQSLNFCEVPRLLAGRRSLVSVQVGDLNNTMLDVLATAFREVGTAA